MNYYWSFIHPCSYYHQGSYISAWNSYIFQHFNHYDGELQQNRYQIISVQAISEANLTTKPVNDSRNHAQELTSAQKSQKIRKNNSEVTDSSNFKYVKKNAQSNIINQIFSYISTPSKSRKVLLKILHHDCAKMELFYTIIKQLKKKNKKYINRDYIKRLLMDLEHLIHEILRKHNQQITFTSEELQKTIRVLINFYFRNICLPTLLTSIRLDKITMKEHVQRSREVYQYLKYHLNVKAN